MRAAVWLFPPPSAAPARAAAGRGVVPAEPPAAFGRPGETRARPYDGGESAESESERVYARAPRGRIGVGVSLRARSRLSGVADAHQLIRGRGRQIYDAPIIQLCGELRLCHEAEYALIWLQHVEPCLVPDQPERVLPFFDRDGQQERHPLDDSVGDLADRAG